MEDNRANQSSLSVLFLKKLIRLAWVFRITTCSFTYLAYHNVSFYVTYGTCERVVHNSFSNQLEAPLASTGLVLSCCLASNRFFPRGLAMALANLPSPICLADVPFRYSAFKRQLDTTQLNCSIRFGYRECN